MGGNRNKMSANSVVDVLLLPSNSANTSENTTPQGLSDKTGISALDVGSNSRMLLHWWHMWKEIAGPKIQATRVCGTNDVKEKPQSCSPELEWACCTAVVARSCPKRGNGDGSQLAFRFTSVFVERGLAQVHLSFDPCASRAFRGSFEIVNEDSCQLFVHVS